MTRPLRIALVLATVTAALAGGAYLLTTDSDDATLDASVAVAEAMAGDTTGYRRASEVRDFTFPADHGPHPGYKTEWWYVTGNLDADTGRHIGYELTIFRIAMTPPDATPVRLASADSSTSTWATNQYYMAHFALTDATGQTFYDFERFSRGAAGLAGAQASPFRVWLEDWSMTGTETDAFPMRLRAQQGDVGLDVTLRPQKPPVYQGDRGLSQKGPGAGNASYYYSYTRLAADGTVRLGADTLQVTGQSWLDREWSTSALGEDQVGWDWFALQFEDGRDLMYYQLRNRDGSPSTYSEGVLVGPDGEKTAITREDVTVEVQDRWTTPDGQRTYPVAWRLRVLGQAIDLRIEAVMNDQELDAAVRYWEGAVRVDGSAAGRGYVEMTGYGGADTL